MHTPGVLRDRWDELVGPGAGAFENGGTLIAAAGGALAAVRSTGDRQPAVQIVLAVTAADLWGGAWANNTRSCAQWYERPGQGAGRHLAFAATHVHPFVVGVIDRQVRGDRSAAVWAASTYTYLMAATSVIRALPHRRRMIGLAATLGAVALDRLLGPSPTAPWFAPVFAVKLLMGHAAAVLWSDASLTA